MLLTAGLVMARTRGIIHLLMPPPPMTIFNWGPELMAVEAICLLQKPIIEDTTMKAVIFMLLLCSSIAAVRASPCLPDNVGSALATRFPGWKLVELQDLREDDQSLLRERPGADCPGVAEGNFERKGEKSYAVTLYRKEGDLKQILVVYSPKVADAKRNVIILDGPSTVSYLSVIWKIDPGVNSDIQGKKLKTKLDSIMYEAIESGSVLYYFSAKSYRHIQLSE